MELNFKRDEELKKMGGVVYDFYPEDEVHRSQHYEWLLPLYYKNADKEDAAVNKIYLESRTCTVKRTLVPNV